MAWSNSKIFQQTIIDGLGNVTALDLDADVPKVSLFDNTITPSQTVSAANSAYAAGVWASGGVSDATGWPAAGRPLVSATWTASAAVCTYDAATNAPAGTATGTGTAFNPGVVAVDSGATVGVTPRGPSLSDRAVVIGPRTRVHRSVPSRSVLILDDPEELWLLELD